MGWSFCWREYSVSYFETEVKTILLGHARPPALVIGITRYCRWVAGWLEQRHSAGDEGRLPPNAVHCALWLVIVRRRVFDSLAPSPADCLLSVGGLVRSVVGKASMTPSEPIPLADLNSPLSASPFVRALLEWRYEPHSRFGVSWSDLHSRYHWHPHPLFVQGSPTSRVLGRSWSLAVRSGVSGPSLRFVDLSQRAS